LKQTLKCKSTAFKHNKGGNGNKADKNKNIDIPVHSVIKSSSKIVLFDINNLGQVELLYTESSRKLNVLRYATPKQGKSILPEWDTDFYGE
jgi:hypothetical protein